MRKKILKAVIVCSLFVTADCFAMTIIEDNMPVQKNNMSSQVIYLLPKGAEVEVLSTSGNMRRINYTLPKDGTKLDGWIKGENNEGNQITTSFSGTYGRIYDYVVKTDAAGALPTVTNWQDLQKILNTYPTKNKVGSTGTYKLHQTSICKALMAAQEKYKINALYLASSSIWTSGGGRNMKYKNNILNIFISDHRTFSSVEECILAAGNLLQSKYFTEGRITVRTIRQKWNPEAGDQRAIDIARQMVTFYQRAIDNNLITDNTFVNKFKEIWNNTSNKNMNNL